MSHAGRVLLAALLASGCAGVELKDLNPLHQEETIEQEMANGAQVHAQIRASGALVNDPVILAYINDLGQQVVRVTEPQPFIYRFNLVDADSLNAFAVPGGYIYFHTGVLEQAGNVSELMGVLAHEVAHVRLRHIAKTQEAQAPVQLVALAAAVLSGGNEVAIAAAQGLNVSLQLKHTRNHEAEADEHGIDYMVRAGYDPHGMPRFFERLLAAHGSGPDIPPYLFSHPDLKDRIAAARMPANTHGLIKEDDRLEEIQDRLALVLNPIAGGHPFHARQVFDHSVTDPLLAKAKTARENEDLEEAVRILRRAEETEPNDPRVPLELADIAESKGHFEEAALQYQRAIALDPEVPLVQYKMGLAHKKLGNRSQAVFYLEQAVNGFGPRSSLRRNAELEIQTLSFPLLEESELGTGSRFAREIRTRFEVGETVTWWGSVSDSLMEKNPLLHVRWIDPEGVAVKEDNIRMDPFGNLSASYDTEDAQTGRWEVRVFAGASEIERREFFLHPLESLE
ncbi:MAG: M48 family metalloprotease [Myxococcota bacterium]